MVGPWCLGGAPRCTKILGWFLDKGWLQSQRQNVHWTQRIVFIKPSIGGLQGSPRTRNGHRCPPSYWPGQRQDWSPHSPWPSLARGHSWPGEQVSSPCPSAILWMRCQELFMLFIFQNQSMFKVHDARTLPRWKPPWRRWLKLGLVRSLFLLGHLRLSWAQTLLIWVCPVWICEFLSTLPPGRGSLAERDWL